MNERVEKEKRKKKKKGEEAVYSPDPPPKKEIRGEKKRGIPVASHALFPRKKKGKRRKGKKRNSKREKKREPAAARSKGTAEYKGRKKRKGQLILSSLERKREKKTSSCTKRDLEEAKKREGESRFRTLSPASPG